MLVFYVYFDSTFSFSFFFLLSAWFRFPAFVVFDKQGRGQHTYTIQKKQVQQQQQQQRRDDYNEDDDDNEYDLFVKVHNENAIRWKKIRKDSLLHCTHLYKYFLLLFGVFVALPLGRQNKKMEMNEETTPSKWIK